MKKTLLLFVLLLPAVPVTALSECVEGDCENGYGVYIFPEGGSYAGQFAGGEFAGRGSQEFSDGNRYEGYFVNGAPHGEGTMTFADSSVYSGNFAEGVIQGQGSIVFANNSRYEGLFADGLFDGEGLYTFADGSRYRGEFKKGLFHGRGTIFSDGRVYVGGFKKGEYHGRGTMTYFDRSRETGEWQDGTFVVLEKAKAPEKQAGEGFEEGQEFGGDAFSAPAPWEHNPGQESFLPQEDDSAGQ